MRDEYELERALSEVNSTIDDLRYDLRNAEEIISDLRYDVRALERKVATLEEELRVAEDTIEVLRADREELIQERGELYDKLEDLEAKDA